ncbi:MAG TPA: VOC family protein [Acidimicrobiales bacterium]|nr:VOC family protein [Acidimicrobiales bacterium]
MAADGSALRLAKDRIDVGHYTNRWADGGEAFWRDTVGLAYEELLKVGNGVHQHRFGVRGSVCKVNAARAALPVAPTAFRRLRIADEALEEPVLLPDPDGTEVELVPVGHDGVTDLGVVWATRDADGLGRLLVEGFSATDEGDGRHRLGTSVLQLVHDPDVAPVDAGLFAAGFRYLTVQVWDVRAEHTRLLDAGWSEGRAPVKLGETAFISFVRDPGGSWIEVSQRASLTGPLPDA